jgi:hypothetical protein
MRITVPDARVLVGKDICSQKLKHDEPLQYFPHDGAHSCTADSSDLHKSSKMMSRKAVLSPRGLSGDVWMLVIIGRSRNNWVGKV